VRIATSLRTRCECRRRSAPRSCSRPLAAQNSPSGRISPHNDAEIGRECTAELVPQPEAGIDIGKSGADETRGVGFAVDIELNLWLQDEPLREEKVVGGLELGGKMALAAHIARGLQIEEVRGEALNAEGGPIARGP